MHRVAVVEDEALIRATIVLNLKKQGYHVSEFADGETFLNALASDSFDVILLDILLPGVDGVDLIQQIRAHGILTPVLMVTAKSDVPTKILLFEKGADDYVAKPFDMAELMIRVKALIRRSQSARSIAAEELLKINGFEIRLDARKAESNLGLVTLTEKEADLLRFFVLNQDRTLSRLEILEEVWGMDVAPTPRTIDNFVVRFRKLFEDNPEHPRHFITVRAQGYRFDSMAD